MRTLKKWPSVESYLKDPPAAGGRPVKGVVIHHTAVPDHSDWAGDRSADGIMGYWVRRTKELRWRNPLGAHYLVSPAGEIYLCFGHAQVLNANTSLRANRTTLSIEIVGNFDKGRDVLRNPQKHAALGLAAALLHRYGLTERQISFHRDYTDTKSCPGTGLDLGVFRSYAAPALAWVKRLRPSG